MPTGGLQALRTVEKAKRPAERRKAQREGKSGGLRVVNYSLMPSTSPGGRLRRLLQLSRARLPETPANARSRPSASLMGTTVHIFDLMPKVCLDGSTYIVVGEVYDIRGTLSNTAYCYDSPTFRSLSHQCMFSGGRCYSCHVWLPALI